MAPRDRMLYQLLMIDNFAKATEGYVCTYGYLQRQSHEAISHAEGQAALRAKVIEMVEKLRNIKP